MSSGPLAPLVTPQDILRVKADRDEAAARVAELDLKLAGIRAFIGAEAYEVITGTPSKPPRKEREQEGRQPTFRRAILKALDGAEAGLTYDELREALTRAGMGDRLARSPNSFFNTVARLIAQKEAVKAGGKVFSREAFDNLPAEQHQRLEAESARDTTPDAVIATLKAQGHGMSAAAIIEKMVSTHPYIKATAIYAAVSRMTKDRTLRRDEGGRYSIADPSSAP